MILGSISELTKQKNMLPSAVVRALEVLQGQDLANMEPGRYEIEGDQLFYLIQDAMPRTMEGCKSEAHATYADVQLPVSARERFGMALPQEGLEAEDDRIDSHDIAFYPTPDNEFFMDIEPGSYAVFLPGELHRPCVVIDDQIPFRKVVVKIHRDLLDL